MKIKTNINDFILDSKDECLKGKIKNPKFSLAGAKIEVNKFTLIEGFIVELFSVTDLKQVEFRVNDIHFENKYNKPFLHQKEHCDFLQEGLMNLFHLP